MPKPQPNDEDLKGIGQRLADVLEKNGANANLVQFCRENPRLAAMGELLIACNTVIAAHAVAATAYYSLFPASHAAAAGAMAEAACAGVLSLISVAVVGGAASYQAAENAEKSSKARNAKQHLKEKKHTVHDTTKVPPRTPHVSRNRNHDNGLGG